MKCPNCEHETDFEVCEECGTKVSDLEDKMVEELVPAASLPNLGAIFENGKALGYVKPQSAGSEQHN